MNSASNLNNRRYASPTIEVIILENEISLTLDSSTPPDDAPGESYVPEYFNDNPYKNNYT